MLSWKHICLNISVVSVKHVRRMSYFKNTTVWGGGGGDIMAPSWLSCFYLNHDKIWSTYRIWQVFSSNSLKKFRKWCHCRVLTSSFVSGYGILWNFELLYFWTDLVEIWLRGQILGADSESEVIFTLEADIGHCFAILPSKKRQELLDNRVAMATIKVTDKQNFYFWMLNT